MVAQLCNRHSISVTNHKFKKDTFAPKEKINMSEGTSKTQTPGKGFTFLFQNTKECDCSMGAVELESDVR